MRRHIFYTLGLALALTGAGAWAVDQQPAGNDAGAGTALQNPAPANPNPPAPPDQAAPNAAPANPAPPDQAQPNPAPANPAQPNPAPQNPDQANPAPVNPPPPAPEQPNAVQPNPPAPGAPGPQAATPTYSSPLQEFMSRQLDEVGALSDEITQFRAAKRPEAVMAMYHMIRDHRLLADAAANILARRGDATTPAFTVMPAPNSPEEAIRQQIQVHQQTQSDLQQMIANASAPDEKRLYQRALDDTNQHLTWLQSLDQNQKVAVGFFGPTTPLGDLIGTTTVASATGYPQPVVTRTAGIQQQFAGNNSAGHGRRTAMRRSYRHRRYHRGRYSRSYRYNRTTSYR